jgi:hypothetical protein
MVFLYREKLLFHQPLTMWRGAQGVHRRKGIPLSQTNQLNQPWLSLMIYRMKKALKS